jgi:hypothetical protein
VSNSTVAQPHAGAIGEPERKWYIVPAVIPVPPPLPKDDAPVPDVEPIAEPEPERVG